MKHVEFNVSTAAVFLNGIIFLNRIINTNNKQNLNCNKNYQHKFDKKLKEQYVNTYKFTNHNNNKFILLLQKRVYPYEYMEYYENSMKRHFLERKNFTFT